MDVPEFPQPPVFKSTVTSSPIREVSDAAPSTAASSETFSKRNVLCSDIQQRSCSCCCSCCCCKRKRRRFGSSRNTVHPIARTGIQHSVTRSKSIPGEMVSKAYDDDDNDVIVCIETPSTISEDRAVSPKLREDIENNINTFPLKKSTGIQTYTFIPYRLRVLPSLTDISEEANGTKKTSRILKHLRFLGRLSLCQLGLVWLLSLWAVGGAAAFYATEGPRERQQVLELQEMQRDLAVGLATELRQLKTQEGADLEPLWSNKVRQYVAKHEKLLLGAVNSGYGEGGENEGQLWTFPGCILFAISLLTTLGFGAPVPRTTAGRTVAVVFAAIGIPVHFLLVLNVGLLLAIRLQKYAVKRNRVPENSEENSFQPIPKWVKAVPFGCIAAYYIIGIMGFGVARSRPFAASILFPLDFTAAGGLATTAGHVRILYGIYLEGAVTIAAVALAVLKVSASQSLTNIGLKYGLLTDS